MSTQTAEVVVARARQETELERILADQRTAFLREGPPGVGLRRNRIDRLMAGDPRGS